MKKINNIESDITNLHSFFIDDLEKAKNINTDNLDRYFNGFTKDKKIDLEIKRNIKYFNKILEPKNYPLGRFLSNPEYALSLMQQIAVNISVSKDENIKENIKSVNGPPGTGKTTLLKDIFADFIVSQAYEICKLSNKNLKDNLKKYDGKKIKIKILPENISNYNIVVASSNNGAVQNIVNELPLLKDVDKEFLEDIEEIDYFKEIMNTKNEKKTNSNKDNKNEEISEEETNEEAENLNKEYIDAEKWGLFSLEGGKKANQDNILGKIERVYEELKTSESNPNIYKEFLDDYSKLKELRENFQKYYENENYISYYKEKIEELETKKEQSILEINLLESCLDKLEKEDKEKKEEINNEIKVLEYELKNKEDEKDLISKPIFYTIHKILNTSSYKNYIEEITASKKEIIKIRENISNLTIRKTENDKYVATLAKASEDKIKNYKDEINKSDKERTEYINKNNEYREFNEKVKDDYKDFTTDLIGIKEKLKLENDKIQLFNPWFNIEIRKFQAKLFIKAMAVKKQFLKDNSSYSLYQSKDIWKNQKKYKSEEIEYAWRWINFTIPVISTTFASFSRMFANLNENSIANLFIDEAGQAIPQAAVGAIFRSKKVMVVGDPLQITPVLTVDDNTLNKIGKKYNLKDDEISKFLSKEVSVQSIVDDTSKYGFYYNKDKEEEKWVGIPLWVHRRSKYPMFDISNEIAYNNLMVQGIPKPFGKADFIDVQGKSNGKFVKEQVDKLIEKLSEKLEENKKEEKKEAGEALKKIYIISPFKNVVEKTKKFLEDDGKGIFSKDFIKTNIGTVHTFQGKEADIVYFVLGCDETETGSLRLNLT